jgi:hypothetical protein
MQTQELIELLEQQAKEISNANHAGWGNTMLEAACKLKRYVLAMDHIYNENETARKAVIKHFGLHHK